MSDEKEYSKLVKEFSLLRRPYITLAQAINKIETDFRNANEKANIDKVASFDFYIFNINPHPKKGREKYFFRWLPGFDIKKFENILNESNERKNRFNENINSILHEESDLDDLTKFYELNIKAGIHTDEQEKLKYLLAIYHMTYWVNVPLKCNTADEPVFLSGLVHDLHSRNKGINSDTGVLGYVCELLNERDDTDYKLRKVDIESKQKYQVTEAFAQDAGYKSFFKGWISAILGENKNDSYKSLIFFPIYDSLEINHGTLRGYLGINCIEDKKDATRYYVRQYIEENYRQVQFEINNAFIKGTHNDILDRYMSLNDAIDHWYNNLYRLHNWEKIEKSNASNVNDEIWTIVDDNIVIDIEKVIDRSTVVEKPISQYKYLNLALPCNNQNLSLNIQLAEDNTYIQNRVSEMISLLDDILVRWQVLKQSTKSAISAVISRNMSHNIGSHVLSKYGTAESILSLANGNDEQCYSFQETNKIKDGENKIAKLIANNNSYLKSRMDYLADLATSVPTLETNKLLYREVLSNLDKNRILLNHISGIDEFNYKIVLKDCRYPKERIIEENSQDIIVSIPNDILGCHALFVIIENIIRNTAKHGNRKPQVNFTLEVHESKEDNSLYEVLIYDDISINRELTEEEKKELPEELKESFKKIDWLVFKQNTNINKSVLDPLTNKLRQGAWGLIEMDVSAAYLRKIASDEVELDDYELDLLDCNSRKLKKSKNVNILKAVKVNNCLGYRFHIAKPKNYLLVGNYNLTDDAKTKIENEGILILSEKQFNPEKEIYSHQFLLYENIHSIKNRINKNKSSLTPRVIELTEQLQKQITQIIVQEKCLECIDQLIWPIWTKTLMKNKSIWEIKCSGVANSNKTDVGTNHFSFQSETKSGRVHNALILSHGDKWNEVVDNRTKEGEKIFTYIEPMPSRVKNIQLNYNSTNDALDFGELTDENKKARISEFLITKVGVIDERIQEFLVKDYDAEKGIKIKYKDIFSNTGIIIPEKKYINLCSMDFSHKEKKEEKSIKEKLEHWFKNNLKDMDALIIHLGILEKLLKDSDKSDVGIRNYISENIIKENQDIIVVITSGRGQPHNLPHSERFVNLSAIIDCLVEGRSKYKLNNLIFSARRLRG